MEESETVKVKSGAYPLIEEWCKENVPSYLDGSFSIFEKDNEELEMPLDVDIFLTKIAEAKPKASYIIFV